MSTAQVLLAVREFEDLVLNSRLLKKQIFLSKGQLFMFLNENSDELKKRKSLLDILMNEL